MDSSSSPSALVAHKGAEATENPCVDSSILSLGTSDRFRLTLRSDTYIASFWDRVDKVGGPIHPVHGKCWPWMGGRLPAEYGWVHFPDAPPGRRTRLAHRVAAEISLGGPLAPGVQVLHRCDYPPCCRPEHLRVGTHADNMADKVAKGRQSRGERSGHNVLTDAHVSEIRSLRASGAVVRDLAVRFGVSHSLISHICHGKGWRHLPMPQALLGGRPLADGRRRIGGGMVEQIKTLRSEGVLLREIAKRCGISVSTASVISRGPSHSTDQTVSQ